MNKELTIGTILVNVININDCLTITRVNDKTYSCGWVKVYKENLRRTDESYVQYRIATEEDLKILKINQSKEIIEDYNEQLELFISNLNELKTNPYFNSNKFLEDVNDVLNNLIVDLEELKNDN